MSAFVRVYFLLLVVALLSCRSAKQPERNETELQPKPFVVAPFQGDHGVVIDTVDIDLTIEGVAGTHPGLPVNPESKWWAWRVPEWTQGRAIASGTVVSYRSRQLGGQSIPTVHIILDEPHGQWAYGIMNVNSTLSAGDTVRVGEPVGRAGFDLPWGSVIGLVAWDRTNHPLGDVVEPFGWPDSGPNQMPENAIAVHDLFALPPDEIARLTKAR